ncbi:MAG TPA: hypothetical protein VLJ76_05495 [Gaiellaceae bacterium]|nr:hypothetical protein [Gaiellaceae bacterium]
MQRIARFRPSPALVVASIALLVALGGTGYAATALPANSVGTAQLKNAAVTAAKVKPGSLLKSSFAANQLPAVGALAYAHVNRDGTLDTALSKNVTMVPAIRPTSANEADYCLKVTGKQAPHNAVASLDLSASGDKHIAVIVGRDLSSSCQGNADALVATSLDVTASQTNSFYIVFN